MRTQKDQKIQAELKRSPKFRKTDSEMKKQMRSSTKIIS